MGRQIRFFMLPGDDLEFIHFVKTLEGAYFCRRRFLTFEEMVVDPEGAVLPGDQVEARLVIAFSQFKLLKEHFHQVEDPNPPHDLTLYMDLFPAPVIEFSRCFFNPQHELIQGRLWIELYYYIGFNLYYKGDPLKECYEKITRWLRNHYRRVKGLDGYFGAQAEEAFRLGELRVFPPS